MRRLRAHEIVLVRDDERRRFHFYATSRREALALAEAWGRSRGWTVAS